MKQVFLNIKRGTTEVQEVPAPSCQPGMVTIQSTRTLISAGTERMLMEFGRKNLLGKARSQPEKVKQVLRKMQSDGIRPTLEAVFSILGEPMPIGYCQTGRILEVGPGVEGLHEGQRVISNGQHAEVVMVPANLCAPVPDAVSDDEAAFTVIGSIALQGIRLASPSIGETIFVSGLGIIGLLTVQMLRANGCVVIGADYNSERVALARKMGCEAVDLSRDEDPVQKAMVLTDGQGVDAALITAATSSNTPVSQAAAMSRKRGKIILVGVTGLKLDRDQFYAKELTFQVSCSYGPGRYDPQYEDKGLDYPYGFVRWTEKRNFQAVLTLMAAGKLDVQPLITNVFSIDEAPAAYKQVLESAGSLGVLLKYSTEQLHFLHSVQHTGQTVAGPTFAIQGAGNFTKLTMLPALKKIGWLPVGIASASGQTAAAAARSFGIGRSTTEAREFLEDESISTVFITTRHNAHPDQVVAALQAGKNVFVEKPLAIDMEGLRKVHHCYLGLEKAPLLMVGFNRRFAPHMQEIARRTQSRSGPLCFHYLVNAGALPATHWVIDPLVGGGRLIGEGCHFVDLFLFLAGSRPTEIFCTHVKNAADGIQADKSSIIIRTEDGSVGTINYWANGAPNYPKEKCEVFFDGKTVVMDNYRQTNGFGIPGFKNFKTRGMSKGHREQFTLLRKVLERGENPLISYEQLLDATLVTFAAVESARTGQMQKIGDWYAQLEVATPE